MIKDTQEIARYEREALGMMIRRFPLSSFQCLNKELNKQGLCISIITLEEAGFEGEFTCPRCNKPIDNQNDNNFNPEHTWIQCPDCGHRQPTKLFF